MMKTCFALMLMVLTLGGCAVAPTHPSLDATQLVLSAACHPRVASCFRLSSGVLEGEVLMWMNR